MVEQLFSLLSSKYLKQGTLEVKEEINIDLFQPCAWAFILGHFKIHKKTQELLSHVTSETWRFVSCPRSII